MNSNVWKTVKLCEIYEFSSGLSKNAKEFGFGFPFLSFKTIFNNYFVPNNIEDLANTTEKEQEACSIKKGDVFLTRTSENLDELGMSCVALKDYPGATFNGFTKRLRPKTRNDIEPKYAGYYFRSPLFRDTVTSMASMTTRASLNNEILSRLPIILPPIELQKEIGNILYSLEKKIELNYQLIKNLEEMAQTIFRNWFVDFEPFNDGEFEESELGKIPKGWKVVELGQIVEEIKDKVNNLQLPVLSAVKTGNLVLSEEYFTKQVFSKNISKYVVVKPLEFAYNPARINIGSIGMNEFEYYGCVSPVYVAFRCNPKYKWFMKMYIRTDRFNTEVNIRALGSVRQTLNYNEFSRIKLVYPPIDFVDKFNLIFETLYKSQKEFQTEINTLETIRDSLLPKLISGEIHVPIEEVE